MKIAYLVNAYPRPSQSFIRREMAALEAHGVHVDRYAIRPGEPARDASDQEEAGRTKYVLSVGAVGLLLAVLGTIFTHPREFMQATKLAWSMGRRGDRGVLIHLIYLAEACVLRRWLAESGAQHVHAHFGTNSTTVAMLCNALGGPAYSFTAHGPEEFDKPLSLGLGEKITRSAFVVAVCEFGRSQLFRWCGHEQWGKVRTVRCGVDELFLNAPPQAVPPTRQLLSVGRLTEQKGQLLLIEAAGMLADQGVDFQLVLVGDGELRGEIESLIEKRGLASRVTLAGWKSNLEIRDLMLQSRALVMPSFAEGLPVVLMEALALRRPVLSTYIAGIPELVRTDESGLLVPAGDVTALADAMAELLAAGPETLARWGHNGAQRVRQRHDASIEAAELAGHFRRAIADAESETDPLKPRSVCYSTPRAI